MACGTIHCLCTKCPNKEAPTGNKQFPEKALASVLLIETSDGVTNAAKLNINGSPHVVTCAHTLNCKNPKLKVGDKTASIDEHRDKYITLVDDLEVVGHKWDELKGNYISVPSLPVKQNYQEIEKLVKTDTPWYLVGFSPETDKIGMTGLPRVVLRNGKLHHNGSTKPGSCGGLICCMVNGQIFAVAIHGGTLASGDLPNYGHLFCKTKPPSSDGGSKN